jgi:putative transposase
VTEMIDSMPGEIDAQQAEQLVARARTEGIDLVGPGGLLTGLTKTVLETALETELTEHLGYDKHDPAGRNRANSRNCEYVGALLRPVG